MYANEEKFSRRTIVMMLANSQAAEQHATDPRSIRAARALVTRWEADKTAHRVQPRVIL